MAQLKKVIRALLKAEHPMSCRGVFYQLSSALRVIEKKETECKAITRLLGKMRRAREIPFSWITDGTRTYQKPQTHGSMGELLEDSLRLYRQDLWRRQQVHVEVWIEKLALSGVVLPVTYEWGVPLFVTRGYASIASLESAAREMETRGKPTVVLYYGDYDPSGVDIPRKAEEDLRDFAPGIELDFRREAVRRSQIIAMGLPTRPTKSSDSRSANFNDTESVELDAIPASKLREMVASAIDALVDADELAKARLEEAEHRRSLEQFVETYAA